MNGKWMEVRDGWKTQEKGGKYNMQTDNGERNVVVVVGNRKFFVRV